MRWIFPNLCLAVLLLVGCTSRQTQQAISQSEDLSEQKHFQEATEVLNAALSARADTIRAQYVNAPANDIDTLETIKKAISSDREVLQLERASLLVALKADNIIRAASLYADIKAGNPSDACVIDLLSHPDLRLDAIQLLGTEPHPDALAALEPLAKDPDKEIRRAVVTALGSLQQPEAVPTLIAALKDDNWAVRSDAADSLGRLRAVSAISALLDTMADSDSSVRNSAASSLLLIVHLPHTPVDDFAKRLNDPEIHIQTMAAIGTALLHDPRAEPVLTKIITTAAEANLRSSAISALGESGDTNAVPLLRQMLQDKEINVRGCSIIALGKLHDTGSIPALQALRDDASQPSEIRAVSDAVIQLLNSTNNSESSPHS